MGNTKSIGARIGTKFIKK